MLRCIQKLHLQWICNQRSCYPYYKAIPSYHVHAHAWMLDCGTFGDCYCRYLDDLDLVRMRRMIDCDGYCCDD